MTDLIGISFLIIVGFLFIAFLIKRNQTSQNLVDIVSMLEKNSKEDRKLLLETLSQNTRSVNERLDRASDVIAGVQRNIGEFSEIGRGMKELHELLRAPKTRGILGEFLLYDLLQQHLPSQSYKTQYHYKNGSVVDAVIFTSQGIIPIDAKFPFDHYRQMLEKETKQERQDANKLFVMDVKKHIRDIGSKYINPEEKTVNYAIMYVPSETVYYEIISDKYLYTYAESQQVMIVSPTIFFAFMKAVLMSFEGQKMEEQAQEIVRALHTLQQDHSRIIETLETLNRHITNAYNTVNTVYASATRMGQHISSIRQLEKPAKKD